MRVLVACEESQEVCKAFREVGHEAFSCDIQECSGGHPEWHIKNDVLNILGKCFWNDNQGWDLIIAHPPCTYLCVPGAHYLHKQEGRWAKMEEAREFFMKLLNSPCKKIAVENPAPHKYAKLPKYSQIIHPWQHGHEFSKRTCLWLKGLPNIEPTKIMKNKGDRYVRKDGSSSNSKWYAKASPKERSKTFPGIAKAMAEQWGGSPNLNKESLDG